MEIIDRWNGVVKIRGVLMVGFSVEKGSEGGISKDYLTSWLKDNNIDYSFSGAYIPYVGQYAIWIEKSKQDKVSKFLWG